MVAVLINAPAKRRKGSNGYFSIMTLKVELIGNYTILGIYTPSWTEDCHDGLFCHPW